MIESGHRHVLQARLKKAGAAWLPDHADQIAHLRVLRGECPPFLVSLLFLDALFWAKTRDPFSRHWFTLKTAEHGSFKCVAVLPKPIRRCPVIIYAHGSGGTLMNDGKALRQMAELGLVAVSLEYNQTNEVAFTVQFETLLRHLNRQKWAATNALAWVGFSLGANRMLDFALQHPELQPQLLVQLSGAGLDPSSTLHPPSSNLRCPVLLIHREQDEIFPVADSKRLAAVLQTNGASAELKIIPGLPHGLEPERGVVFRCIAEYCRSQLVGKDAWQSYHSIARWQTEAPALWWFWLPAVVVAGVLACRRAGASRPAEMPVEQPRNKATKATLLNLVPSLLGCVNLFGRLFRAAGRAPSTPLKRREITLRWLAVLLAAWALAETAVHLVTPHFSVNDTTLAIARRFLVSPKQNADFEYLAAQPIWQNAKLRTLLDHVELAGYNRELINWQLDDKVYQDFVLSPVITSHSGEKVDWRRPLWEEFYPRIRREASAQEAAKIVVRHLRERVTVSNEDRQHQNISEIWELEITDAEGFERIYVATLRSVGIPAKISTTQKVEIFSNGQWLAAPLPPRPTEMGMATARRHRWLSRNNTSRIQSSDPRALPFPADARVIVYIEPV